MKVERTPGPVTIVLNEDEARKLRLLLSFDVSIPNAVLAASDNTIDCSAFVRELRSSLDCVGISSAPNF